MKDCTTISLLGIMTKLDNGGHVKSPYVQYLKVISNKANNGFYIHFTNWLKFFQHCRDAENSILIINFHDTIRYNPEDMSNNNYKRFHISRL